MEKSVVTLNKDGCDSLISIISNGNHKSQKNLKALLILGCDEGGYQIKRYTNGKIVLMSFHDYVFVVDSSFCFLGFLIATLFKDDSDKYE